jgi:hypothetical protein
MPYQVHPWIREKANEVLGFYYPQGIPENAHRWLQYFLGAEMSIEDLHPNDSKYSRLAVCEAFYCTTTRQVVRIVALRLLLPEHQKTGELTFPLHTGHSVQLNVVM